MKILIVEDSNSIAMVVAGMLKEAGKEPVRAVDGKDAIDVIKANPDIALILLDWNMPNMNGLEFLQYNQENSLIKAPIVMMTTENKPEKIMTALQHGAVEYIMKPFTVDILNSKIDSVLNSGQ
jgi:two-component system chemotaxis response regulator CheY